MSFYFSLYQIIEGVERLIHDVQHLASRALRISPRDARANRELLEQCETRLNEVQKILTSKSHISKVTLRKASFLFQILEVNYRRVVHLASATSSVDPGDAPAVQAVWKSLALAQRHYRVVLENLGGLTGIPSSLVLKTDPAVEVPAGQDAFSTILQKETDLQLEALRLLDKAVEVLGEEEGLSDKLAAMRKELIENKRQLRSWSSAPAAKPAPLAPVSLS
jgi:hypothetical protein